MRKIFFLSIFSVLTATACSDVARGAQEEKTPADAVAKAAGARTAPGPALDAVLETWHRFQGALRAGRLSEAYACFSSRSRKRMSYEVFASRYSPITIASQVILSPPVESSTRYSGERAVLKFLIAAPIPDQPPASVQVYLVHEPEGWKLVTEEAWPLASLEADCRSLLLRMHGILSRHGETPASFLEFRTGNPDLVASALFRICVRSFRFRLQADPAGSGWRIVARPHRPDSGLRAFAIGPEGNPVPLGESGRAGEERPEKGAKQ
jgi:hypothetical protein